MKVVTNHDFRKKNLIIGNEFNLITITLFLSWENIETARVYSLSI